MAEAPNQPAKKNILDDFPFTLQSIERADINQFDLTQEGSKESTFRTELKSDEAVENLIQETLAEQAEKAKIEKASQATPFTPPAAEAQPEPVQEVPAKPKATPVPVNLDRPKVPEQYEKTFKDYQVGDIVKGKVMKMDGSGVLVDIGYKADGLISHDKLGAKPGDAASPLAVGDELEVFIEALESKEGYVLLSKKRADQERVWQTAYTSLKKKTAFAATVISVVKGGLVVDFGVRGFIPASQVAKRPDETLEQFVGRTLQVKTIEIDRRQGKVVLSHKQAAGEEKKAQMEKVLDELEVGTVRHGIIRSLKKFGAFVDLGGLEGLVHISEMSWNRVSDPSEVLSVGQEIDVFVLGVDKENGKVALGIKQLQPDPWVEIDKTYKVGEIVKGKVARLAKFGAFIELERGLEGMAHISELSREPVKTPEAVVSVGQDVEVKILRINTEEQKIGLSIKQAQAEREKQDVAAQTHPNTEEGRVTLGDAIKDQLQPHLEEQPPTPPQDAPATAPPLPEEAPQAMPEQPEVETPLPH